MTWLGNRDTRDNVILTGIDAALLELPPGDGTTYDRGRGDGRRHAVRLQRHACQ
jgi:hypothetical protein